MKKKSLETRKIDRFFKKMDGQGLALSYGDVRLRTGHSEILPREVNIESRFSRNIGLKIPIVSSPMDTVTEAKMAIAMAIAGGIGVVHKALTPKKQAAAIGKIKHYLNAFISDPICVNVFDSVSEVLKMKAEKDYKFYSFPVINEDGQVVGLVTRNDFDFSSSPTDMMGQIMSKEIIKADANTTMEGAYKMMMKTRKKILPIFNSNGGLKGIYTWADVKRIISGGSDIYNLDKNGSLIAVAAIGVGEDLEERMELLSREKVDAVVIDTAHGDSKAVIAAIKFCKKYHPEIDVIAGNISEADSARNLIKAGVDGLRVGQGPGSICTTRVIAGIGCPQVSAVYNCSKAARGSGVPICADGGIEFSGDIPIALAAGAQNVMLGKMLAGTTEAPGVVIYKNGRPLKSYRGMGSLGAMLDNKSSRERYFQGEVTIDKLVPEGIEGEVDYRGDVDVILNQLVGGLRSGLGYVGAKDIADLQAKADFHKISGVGLKESHPHGLVSIKDAPNYRAEKFS